VRDNCPPPPPDHHPGLEQAKGIPAHDGRAGHGRRVHRAARVPELFVHRGGVPGGAVPQDAEAATSASARAARRSGSAGSPGFGAEQVQRRDGPVAARVGTAGTDR